MEKNKSIDGLRPNQSRVVASKKATTIKSAQLKRTKSVKNTRVTKPTKAPRAKAQPRRVVTAKQPTNPQNQPIKSQNSETTTQNNQVAIDSFLSPTNVFNFDEENGELEATEITSNSTSNNTSDTTLVESSKSNITDKPNQKPKKEKKPMSKKRKVILSVIITLILLIGGGVTWLVLWGNDIIARITGGQGNVLDLITFMEPTYERLKTGENGRTNILAFGTSGYNMDGDEGDGTHDGAQLTDSIMVISLDQDSGDIVMTSLPRDLKANPTCTATGKINEVYWCNGGGGDATTETEAAAAQALMAEVGEILGLDFQYYAHLNWGSLIQIVDILGGIEVTLDEDIYDYYWTGAVFEAGVPYTIDGEQALGLARARHGTASGDFTRGAS